MKKRKALLLALAMVLVGMCGHAMPVHMDEGPIALTGEIVTDAARLVSGTEQAAESAEEATVETADFQLLCRAADGDMLVFADGKFLKVPADALAAVLEQTGNGNTLPKPEVFTALKRKDNGDAVRAMQEALAAMGYLSSNIDGDFGTKTERALSDFGQAMGLKGVTEADVLLQLLIASAQADTVNIVPDYDPLARYAAIVGKTKANLSAAAEYGLALEYDDIAGTGELSNGNVITLDASGNADIDACAFEIRFVLLVNQQGDGEITVEPGVRVSCECVRRPIMRDMILKLGDARCVVPFTDLSNALSGPKSTEIAVGALDAEAVRAVAEAPEDAVLKLRINGKYRSFDCEVDDIAPIAAICKAAQGL